MHALDMHGQTTRSLILQVRCDRAVFLRWHRPFDTKGEPFVLRTGRNACATERPNEEANECGGLCTAGLWPAFLNLGLLETKTKKIQRRRPEASGTKVKGEKNEATIGAEHLRSRCVLTRAALRAAPTEETATAKKERGRVMRQEFEDALRCCVGTGRNACATERRLPRGAEAWRVAGWVWLAAPDEGFTWRMPGVRWVVLAEETPVRVAMERTRVRWRWR